MDITADTSLARESKSGALFTWSWIVDAKTDLVWITGGGWTGLFLLLLILLGADPMGVWFAWVTLVDTPHFIGTYTRTYFDPEVWKRQPFFLLASLGWLLAGPAVLGLCYLLYRLGVHQYTLPWGLFVGGFLVWAYMHIVRQHWGVFALYRRKESGPLSRWADFGEKWLLHAVLGFPALAFILVHPQMSRELGLRKAGEPALYSTDVLLVICWGLALVFWVHQAWRTWQAQRAGRSVNAVKLLFAVLVTAYTAFITSSPWVTAAPIVVFMMLTTVHHDVQYDAVVWHYHRRRQARGNLLHGLAGWMTRNLGTFLFSGILIAAAFRFLGCKVEIHEGCIPMFTTSKSPLFGSMTLRDLLVAVFLGFPLNHYWIDQFIWRPSQDARLASDLGVGDKSSQA
ncbi:MAG: hypothetical protein SFU85_03190 [Candidatus Methylacidiphilales bacterium]|nr:hypothetical protein [Candidatus Methylacidiphilales bacterium]